jgi:Zn-dependent protease/CBS domain-containing protein
MKWSWKAGRIAGIDLRIHATFLLLLAWVWASYWMAGENISATLAGFGFIAALFTCVVLHEMGHAVMARRFGIRTRDITLLPIGGVARLERLPEDPKQELWVALAGPAVNVALAAFLYSWLIVTHVWEPIGQLRVAAGPFFERLVMANLWLALFNLIPAFPMDGGRVLRALLASRMTYARATQLAASTGQGLAFVLGFIGLFSNPMLLFIALFIWIGASQESYTVQMKSALAGIPASAAMLTQFDKLQSGDTLAEAVRLILGGSQHDLPVLDQGRVIGILTRADLLAALSEFGHDYPVTRVMRRTFLFAEPAEMMEVAFRRLQECDCHTLPVVHEGHLVGLVTMENLGEYLLIEAALRERVPGSEIVKRILRRDEQLRLGDSIGIGSSRAPHFSPEASTEAASR